MSKSLPVALPSNEQMSTARLRVVMLNSSRWQHRLERYDPAENPDPFALTRQLAKMGIDLIQLDPADWPSNPFAGRSPLLDGMDPLRALKLLCRERRADLILCVNEGPAFPLLLLRRIAAFDVPVVVFDLIISERWRLRKWVMNTVVRQADGLFVLTAFQRDYVASQWGRAQGVEVMGQGIDTEFWRAAPPQPDGPIVTVGQDHSRDFDLLLSAMEGLDAELLMRTSRIPPERTLPPGTSVLRERMSDVELRDLYARSRFVVVPLRPSLNAGGINTILEAAAMGRALIVNDSPAIRDLLIPGVTCLTVPCGDARALRAAIQRLLQEPETCATLGANAREFIERHASVVPVSRRLADALRRYAALRRSAS